MFATPHSVFNILTRAGRTTTASLANGALVLRHEIGHSIIDIGEEYDGGYAYYGVNAVNNPSAVTWSHWLEHQEGDGDTLRAQRSVMPMQAYPWTLLNTTDPWTLSFLSSGKYSRHLIKFSLSGIPNGDDLVILFDRVDLRWVPRKDIGVDRWHYDVYEDTPLSAGAHEISFVLKNGDLEGSAQLCSVEVLEYGTEAECVVILPIWFLGDLIPRTDSTRRLVTTAYSRRE